MEMFDSFMESMPAPVLSVSDLNTRIEGFLKNNPYLSDIWVRGEVSGAYPSASGHLYFDLKDPSGKIKCTIWKSSFYSRRINKADITNGAEIEVHGNVDYYKPGGETKIIVDAVRTRGMGGIYDEYLKLKDRLEKEGLFDYEHKLPLPPMPRKVGVVTSASGAAVTDIRKTLEERWPLCEMILSPALVQGSGAAASIIRALDLLVKEKPDVIIIGRGGGSMEDLWCFNDEALARKIYACTIPVISAVGHERDFTLVDYVADAREKTPTGAASRAVPDRMEFEVGLDALYDRLDRAVQLRLDRNDRELDSLERRLASQSPMERISREQQLTASLSERLQRAVDNRLSKLELQLSGLDRRLASVSPENVMKRGYAVVFKEDHVADASLLQGGDPVRILFHDGEKNAHIDI